MNVTSLFPLIQYLLYEIEDEPDWKLYFIDLAHYNYTYPTVKISVKIVSLSNSKLALKASIAPFSSAGCVFVLLCVQTTQT